MKRQADPRSAGDGGMAVLSHAGRACPAAPDHGRWPFRASIEEIDDPLLNIN
jgi:hypothetical protein